MEHSNISSTEDVLPFGRLLKFWRNLHGLSQEELAFRLDSSPRHISRMENGRVHPSKTISLRIAKVLEMTDFDRGQLLVAAGYAPASEPVDFHSSELRWLRKAIMFKLKAVEPYPAFLIDGHANILMVNRAWIGFYGQVFSKEKLNNITNYFDFLFNSENADTRYRLLDNVRAMIIMSLQQAAIIRNDDALQAIVDKLIASPNTPQDWQQRAAKIKPTTSFPIELNLDNKWQRFFEITQSFGATGQTVYVSEPNISMHTLYPEDDSLDMSVFANNSLTHPLLYEE